MIPYNLSDWNVFSLVVLAMFAIVVFRYFLVAGFFFLYFYVWQAQKWTNRKLNTKKYTYSQFRTEIFWSIITSFIFALAGALGAVMWQKGWSNIYLNVEEYGRVYFGVSILIAMFFHETFYYWLHRWMHRPQIYRIVHKTHHDSLIASPWTAFSFHPLEALLEAFFLPLLILILPLHPYAIVIHLTIMTLSSVINHLDIEIYPSGFHKNWLGKWLIGATHHSLHHTQFRYNYGLYFTFWDKWMKTESPLFVAKFEEKTKSVAQIQEEPKE